MRKILLLIFILFICGLLVSCDPKLPVIDDPDPVAPTLEVTNNMFGSELTFSGDIHKERKYIYNFNNDFVDDHYKNYYEIFVGSFNDSNGDGLGDLKGIEQKLDYLQELGVTGLWLTPINPSPSYHKYNVTNYCDVDPSFGTIADFDSLVASAESRNIKIILDLVLNHTSNNHPWFQTGMNAFKAGSTSKYSTYYNFSNSKLGPNYVLTNGVYYEAVFGSNMPDLNWDSQDMKDDIELVLKFWLNHGAYGFRLDATSHYFSSHSLNVNVLNWIKATAKKYKNDAYIVGEAWESTGLLETNYYKSKTDSFFNFEYASLIPNIVTDPNPKANNFYNNYFSFLSRITNTATGNNNDAKDALFLSNHDTNRSANSLWTNIYLIKFAASVYLMMPSIPYIYYGEEVGMITNSGNKKDENKRRPFPWSNDKSKNTNGPMGMDNYKEYFPALDIQIKATNANLIYGCYQRLLGIKNQNKEISRGTPNIITSTIANILTLSYTYNGETIYLVYNFNRTPKTIARNELGFVYNDIRGYMASTSEDFFFQNNNITFPALSLLVLK